MTAEPIPDLPTWETNPFVAQIDSLAAKVALLERMQANSDAVNAKFAKWAEIFAKDLTANRDLIIDLDRRDTAMRVKVSSLELELARMQRRVTELFDKQSTI